MNLFVIAVAAGGAVDAGLPERALGSVVDRLPFFPGRAVERWAAASGGCAAAWIAHDGIPHVHAETDRLALFAGRPILWTGETKADGRAPLDPRFHLAPDAWADLDGRYVAARFSGGELEVTSDRLGAYPLFGAHVGGTWLVSNSAEALRAALGGRAMSLTVLAGLLGGGWSLDGHPIWDGIERLPAGVARRFTAGAVIDAPSQLAAADTAALLGHGFDADRAAAVVTASVRALADWPGRPSVVPVTGGRDSRLVLGAALAAGIEFTTTTGGEAGHPDVEIGRELARAADVPHSVLEHDPHGSVTSDWRRAAELLSLTTAGTSSLSDAAGFPFGPRSGAPVLWHSGQGGEVARAYYGLSASLDRDGLAERQYRAFVGRRRGRREILGPEGERLVRAQIGAFVDEQLAAGVQAVDVPDMFYLRRRMGTWAGPSHGAVEFVRDTTSPLWSHRLLPDELGLPARDRARELFHLRVLERLAPQLVDVRFEDGRPWPARQSELRRRAGRGRVLARKVGGELRRRARSAARSGNTGNGASSGSSSSGSSGGGSSGGSGPASDPVARILPEIRDAVLSQPDHEAWRVLDRGRVESLLGSSPAALDTMSRYYAWRLATVFGPTA